MGVVLSAKRKQLPEQLVQRDLLDELQGLPEVSICHDGAAHVANRCEGCRWLSWCAMLYSYNMLCCARLCWAGLGWAEVLQLMRWRCWRVHNLYPGITQVTINDMMPLSLLPLPTCIGPAERRAAVRVGGTAEALTGKQQSPRCWALR